MFLIASTFVVEKSRVSLRTLPDIAVIRGVSRICGRGVLMVDFPVHKACAQIFAHARVVHGQINTLLVGVVGVYTATSNRVMDDDQ